jgi:hypothetical protein
MARSFDGDNYAALELWNSTGLRSSQFIKALEMRVILVLSLDRC